jgi:hypothetical protein
MQQRGRERDYARLLYCIVFFHTMANLRNEYGARGGWNWPREFGQSELEIAVEYFEVSLHTCGVSQLQL